MNLLVDTHTHTVASGHAYSTLTENARAAADKGMEAFVCADHGPEVIGASPGFIINSVLLHLPQYMEGVRMIKGIEANIMDYDGRVDIKDRDLARLEFCVASLHGACIKDGGRVKNTDALIGALNHPDIDVIGHPGNPLYEIDQEAFVAEVARLDKLVEINSHSFHARPGSEANCENILKLCRKKGVRIVVASDAHCCYDIGAFDSAVALIEKCEFPKELIASASLNSLMGYINEKRGS